MIIHISSGDVQTIEAYQENRSGRSFRLGFARPNGDTIEVFIEGPVVRQLPELIRQASKHRGKLYGLNCSKRPSIECLTVTK